MIGRPGSSGTSALRPGWLCRSSVPMHGSDLVRLAPSTLDVAGSTRRGSRLRRFRRRTAARASCSARLSRRSRRTPAGKPTRSSASRRSAGARRAAAATRLEAPGRARKRQADGRAELLAAFRRAVWVEKARIALRELLPVALGGAAIESTARELSALADASLELALAEAAGHVAGALRRAAARGRRAVATWSCSAWASSAASSSTPAPTSICIFVYDTDDGDERGELHDHWTRVVRRPSRRSKTPSADGLVWRVDLRLRPGGLAGPDRELDRRDRALLRDLGPALGARRAACARGRSRAIRALGRAARARGVPAVRLPATRSIRRSPTRWPSSCSARAPSSRTIPSAI